ncbi:hypothetical protein HNQ77_002673 [Silvibacterium bohemicum]|uniref:Uncharacterized protein n=1 Tax=Silvibacterium bohemicum TaxID=1577686 RepID=A0A841JW84_9BACT|nr:hypothetical protein [Silvibacterium bohemicum]MBB6144717.1 hypothetical protein [Silvibacterium bohemicum]
MSYTGSKAQSGRGSALSIGGVTGSTGTETFTLVGEIKTSGISGAQWGTDDVTNFQSNADQEFITTIRNNGSLRLDGNRVSTDAGQVAVEAAFASGSKYDFKLVLPLALGQTTTGDTYTFSALVESRDFTVDVSKAISWSVTLKVSGPVTLTTGS